MFSWRSWTGKRAGDDDIAEAARRCVELVRRRMKERSQGFESVGAAGLPRVVAFEVVGDTLVLGVKSERAPDEVDVYEARLVGRAEDKP